MADYEEQVLITGVKKGRECPICVVPPDKREDLEQRWEKRTHETSQRKPAPEADEPDRYYGDSEMEEAREDSNDDQVTNNGHDQGVAWAYNDENFAWKHDHVNVHETMMLDGLHQLLKGTVDHLLTWLEKLVAQTIGNHRGRLSGTAAKAKRQPGHVQLDERFRAVPGFTGLRTFEMYSNVSQWTAADRRSVLRQLLPVIAPLLTRHSPIAVHCARAMVDFVLLAQFRGHDEDTLGYLKHAMCRVNKLKFVFAAYRPTGGDSDVGHFNFPKWHMMSHYPEFIREYGAIDNFSTEHSEAAHKYLVKSFFDRTNKRKTWYKQLIKHNTRHLNLVAMETRLLYQETRASALRPEDEVGTAPVPIQASNFVRYLPTFRRRRKLEFRANRYDSKKWVFASELERIEGCEGVLQALAVFVRSCRKYREGKDISDRELYREEEDPSWVRGLYVCLHSGLKCWKEHGKTPNDQGGLEAELVRCVPDWNNEGDWRRDFVLVQDRESQSMTSAGALNGRIPGQLMLILTVADTYQPKPPGGKYPEYSGAWIELLEVRNKGLPHEVHGMVEVQRKTAKGARVLGARRFYALSTIVRSVHIVPGAITGHELETQKQQIFYVNNFVDFDSYNSIYDPDFIKRGTDVANKYEKSREKGKQSTKR